MGSARNWVGEREGEGEERMNSSIFIYALIIPLHISIQKLGKNITSN